MHRNRYSVYLLFLFLLLKAGNLAGAYSASDVDAFSRAFSSAFYVQSGTNGYFKDTQAGGITYFWGQAEEIECIIDAYEWSSNATYASLTTNLLNGFMSNNGSSWTWNTYNDDIMWAVIAFARGGQDTGRTNYCDIAKANFDACYARAWSTNLGGGLYWDTDNASKNACDNGPASIAAYLLYQIYGDTNYWHKATNIYAWERSALFNTNSGAIYDNLGTNGVLSTWASTYNQGTFIGAANFLGQTNDATLAANFTMMNLTSGGILPEYGIAGNNSGFNAIFLRWMTRFMKTRNLKGTYEAWLQSNAAAAWNVRRSADSLSWCQWLHSSPGGTNFYSWDCISSFEALQAADPTQTNSPQLTPLDCAGYWPLDATAGTAASDASGNGNNGTVSGASWKSGGRLNGCLSFNGAGSSVQITNPVSADFSIAFWVKTTQTAGSGQWYQGAGLVDGDTPGYANDFGAALCGGQFCFGVGNPDISIRSSALINDGAWHHCAATRQQGTGSICVYVDGVLQATGSGNENSLNASSRLLFGAIASGGGYFNGSLDDVKIFNRALSSNEVAAVYCNVFAACAAPTHLSAQGGAGQVRLSWWENSAVTSYKVKRSLVSGGPYTTLTNVTGATFTDANVVSNRTCYYVVSALNAVTESADSAEACASPSALMGWLKADALLGLPNGAPVSAWPDASGNGCSAMQLLKANQPTYVAAGMNGLPVVRFNPANSSYLWLYRPVQDDFTIILVFQSSQGIGTGTDFWSGAGLVNGEVGGTVADFGCSLNANGQILAGTGNPDITMHSGAGFNDGRPHVVTFKRIESSGAIMLYVDGSLLGASAAGKESLTAPNLLTLGAQQTLNNYLSGDIAEVQIYSIPLSDTDRQGAERALRCKYGLSGGAVPVQPTGLSGSAGNRRIALSWLLTAGATGYNLWRSIDSGASYQMIATGLTGSSYEDTNAVSGITNYYRVAGSDACGSGTSSLVAGVFLPLPALQMNASAGALTLSWPAWANDWGLWAATNLTPPVTWSSVTNPVGSNNGQFNVSIPINSSIRFFRLFAP